MRFASLITSAVLLSASSLAAHADLITTFTLTRGTDTIQFSLSPSTPWTSPPGISLQDFEFRVPLTFNGVTQAPGTGHTTTGEGFEQLQPLGVGAEFYVQYITGVSNGVTYSTDLFEQGMQVYTYAGGKLTFTPGTYVFTQVYDAEIATTGSSETLQSETLEPGDTLVITQSDLAATPEPSGFWLLGTGALGMMGGGRRRFAVP